MNWLYYHGVALALEYKRRFYKNHKSLLVIRDCLYAVKDKDFPVKRKTPYANCTGIIDKKLSTIQKYRVCLKNKWKSGATWTNAKPPRWK